jgi:hypothetical protein
MEFVVLVLQELLVVGLLHLSCRCCQHLHDARGVASLSCSSARH